MRRMRDFKCNHCEKVHERFEQDNVMRVECTYCDIGTSLRLIGCPTIKLEGITGAFPTAADRWANVHEQAARIGAKRNEGKYDQPEVVEAMPAAPAA